MPVPGADQITAYGTLDHTAILGLIALALMIVTYVIVRALVSAMQMARSVIAGREAADQRSSDTINHQFEQLAHIQEQMAEVVAANTKSSAALVEAVQELNRTNEKVVDALNENTSKVKYLAKTTEDHQNLIDESLAAFRSELQAFQQAITTKLDTLAAALHNNLKAVEDALPKDATAP